MLIIENFLELHLIRIPPAEPTASNEHQTSTLEPSKDLKESAEGATIFDSCIKMMSRADSTITSLIAHLFFHLRGGEEE